MRISGERFKRLVSIAESNVWWPTQTEDLHNAVLDLRDMKEAVKILQDRLRDAEDKNKALQLLSDSHDRGVKFNGDGETMKPYSRYYRCTHFAIQELVDPETYKLLGESAWSLFDPYLLSTMDRIRQRYNVLVTINNWHTGGPFKDRGFRSSDSKTGAKLSAHRRGQAFDFDVEGKTADEVRKDILDNKEHIDFMFINRVEKDVSWVHIDFANAPTRIQVFGAGK